MSSLHEIRLTTERPVCHDFGWDRGTPIDRYYIEAFLSSHRHFISGKVVEIADRNYTDKFGSSGVTSVDVLDIASDIPGVTIRADLSDTASLPSNEFDCFICTQTFQCIFDVRAAIAGAAHMLRHDGILLATVPGISQICRWEMERGGDYWRFTTAAVQRLFSEVFRGPVTVSAMGNALAATALIQGIVVEDLPMPELLDTFDSDYEVVIAVCARRS